MHEQKSDGPLAWVNNRSPAATPRLSNQIAMWKRNNTKSQKMVTTQNNLFSSHLDERIQHWWNVLIPFHNTERILQTQKPVHGQHLRSAPSTLTTTSWRHETMNHQQVFSEKAILKQKMGGKYFCYLYSKIVGLSVLKTTMAKRCWRKHFETPLPASHYDSHRHSKLWCPDAIKRGTKRIFSVQPLCQVRVSLLYSDVKSTTKDM